MSHSPQDYSHPLLTIVSVEFKKNKGKTKKCSIQLPTPRSWGGSNFAFASFVAFDYTEATNAFEHCQKHILRGIGKMPSISIGLNRLKTYLIL